MKVSLISGPKDGRAYDYPEPLPEVLSFQRFDLNMGAHADNYRRRPHTHQYVYVEPGILPHPHAI